MSNPFDQFDPTPEANTFDQFDTGPATVVLPAGTPEDVTAPKVSQAPVVDSTPDLVKRFQRGGQIGLANIMEGASRLGGAIDRLLPGGEERALRVEADRAAGLTPDQKLRASAAAIPSDPSKDQDISSKAVELLAPILPAVAMGPAAPFVAGLQQGGAAANESAEAGDTPEEQRRRLVVNAAGGTALNLLPIPGIKKAGELVDEAVQAIASPLTRDAVRRGARAGAGAVLGGGVNAAGDAAIQLMDTGDIDPAQTLPNTVMGAAIGTINSGAAARSTIEPATSAVVKPKVPVIGAIRAASEPSYQYTIQRPEAHPVTGETIPGYVQIDEIINGVNTRSSNLDALAAEGIALPPPPESLQSGRYSLDEVRQASGAPFTATEQKPLGLLESARRSPEIKPDVQSALEGYYEPQKNVATIAAANRRIDELGDLQKAKEAVLMDENPDAVSHAMGLELVRKFQVEGKFQDAADVLNSMAPKARSQGQAIQILSTLAKSTPEGLAMHARKMFGRDLSKNDLALINISMKRIEEAKAPEVKLTRMAQLLDELHRRAGGSKWDEKMTGLQNMAMLLNPKTVIRNVFGNLMMTTADAVADTLSPAIDAGVSVFTGKRLVSGPQVVEYAKGFWQPVRDFQAGYKEARGEGATRRKAFSEGLETMTVLAKLGATEKTEVGDVVKAYRSVFSSRVMRGFEKTMNVVMATPDRAFYMARLRASLADQMKSADAAVPTAAMLDTASIEAARAIYQDKNFVSNSLRMVRGAFNYGSTLGKSKTWGVGQVVVPFVQVPGSLLLRGLEYSPAGFINALSKTVGPLLPGNRTFSQREFSQAFSRALLGTTGLAATGYWLAKLGIVTGTPDDNPKVRELKRAVGFGKYAINVSALKRAFQSMDWKTRQEMAEGDLVVNYDWAQPMAFPVALGASYADAQHRTQLAGARGKLTDRPTEVLTALMSGAQTVEEQPLLTGLSGFISNASAAKAQGAGYAEALYSSMLQLPGQYVPTAVRQMQQLMDNRVYETRGSDKLETAYQSVAANIPGLAKELGFKPRSDVLGDLAERYQANGNTFFNVLVNPAFVTRIKGDPETRELLRIWETTGEAKQIPGTVDSKITINGRPKVLTAGERADYQQFVGRLTRDAFKQMMRSEGYAGASDEQRAKVLGQVVSSAATAAKIQLFGDRPRAIDRWDRALLGFTKNRPHQPDGK